MLRDRAEAVRRRARLLFRTCNAARFAEAGIDLVFVQDNHRCPQLPACSGLHYQLPPFAQDKLLRVVRGAILDVAVDIRNSSPTSGNGWRSKSRPKNGNQILVPKGFAHGFVTLVPDTEVIYKVTERDSPVV